MDLSTLLLQGEDMIGRLARAHVSWGLGSAQRWDLDQSTGLITWTFPDKTATASAQILGSYNPSTASWLWAWANKSILPEMARDSRAIHNWAETHGHHGLARRRIEADDQQTATIAALAVRITRATGFYRGPGSTAIAVITFGTATLTSRHGEVSTFEIKVD